MPPIAATRSGQNIRRTCKLMNDISTSPTAATKTASTACGSSGYNFFFFFPPHYFTDQVKIFTLFYGPD
ncbi:hypothetical protein LOAG_18945 [Loa loa]|uniref:Uncharacterized protein n=1 Tax=Loa loa TaxID=7209 RepID=A0A1S0UDY5_LOALO|nr:hypothetical protein LOAG_18945 [Loa loa]EJD73641.1 hypothetical protein LOAG_18945 [Loa loa]